MSERQWNHKIITNNCLFGVISRRVSQIAAIRNKQGELNIFVNEFQTKEREDMEHLGYSL